MVDLMRCACPSEDAYRCWATRYGPRDWDIGEIEMDGGPCECPCHDDEDEDTDPWFVPRGAARALGAQP